MKSVKLHPEAEADLRESELFYEERGGSEVASEFLQRVRISFQLIARAPNRFPALTKIPTVRKCRVARFPFTIFYIEKTDFLWIIAVAHSKRRPEYWAERLD